MTGIYKFTNNINGKIYIGQAIHIYRRYNAHKNSASNPYSNVYNYPLYRAIRKYGFDNFSFDILEECDADMLDDREIYWIAQYRSFDPEIGYNLTRGGQSKMTTPEDIQRVTEIIHLLKTTDMTQAEIAEKYELHQTSISNINIGDCWRMDGEDYPIRKRCIYTCIDCGQSIHKGSTRCVVCAKKFSAKVKNRPNREELKNEIRTKSFVSIGKEYGVSNTAVVKWCKTYGLPHKKKDINQYTDEQWANI